MERKTCDGCGKQYWSPGADWQHRDCSKGPADVGLDTPPVLPEGDNGARKIDGPTDKDIRPPAIRGGEQVRRVKRAWKTREEYNLYMKEYMKKWRAKKRV